MIRSPHLFARAMAMAGGLLLAGAWPAQAAAPENRAADAAAQNAIEGLDVATEAGKVVIKLKLRAPMSSAPAGFSLTNPPRVAFDFPNTINALGKNSQDFKEGELRAVRFGQSSGRTRVVLNLDKAVAYSAALDGHTVVITLQAGAAVAASAPAPVADAQGQTSAKPAPQPHSVRAIDFKRGRNGEGQVIIDLSDAGSSVDVRQTGSSVLVELIRTELPIALERRFDVTDFGTPVENMEAVTMGNNARLTIAARGRWEQSAYQMDNRFIVEIKPIVERPGEKPKVGFTGEKLSLNFQNVEVRSVLQVIADFTGLNIITSDTVGGNLTLRLKDVPWDQALDIIMQAKGLDMRKTGNVVWIAPRDELATKEKLALEAQAQIQELEPLRTESFQLNYQKAEAFQKVLTDASQRILSKRGSAVIDPRTNTLFINDVPSKLDEIRSLLKITDVPSRQVLIESRIVEATDTFSKNLGARLGFFNMPCSFTTPSGSQIIQTCDPLGGSIKWAPSGNTQSVGVQTGQAQSYQQAFFPDAYSVNLPALGVTGSPASQWALSLFNAASTRFLNLEISALQVDGNGKIISNPRVITADNVEAIIEQGTEIPYQQSTSSGATSISFRKATLSLKVKPQITPDDNVIMTLAVNKDSVGQTTSAGPSIDTKRVATEVLVENGGTVSLGGIYTQDQLRTVSKVPLLGDLPMVGFLFKSERNQNNRSELLIFVSPKIIRDTVSSAR